MQLARLELEMEELEMMLCNDITNKDVRGWLKEARAEYNKKIGQLNMSMKDMRKDSGTKKSDDKKETVSFFGGME